MCQLPVLFRKRLRLLIAAITKTADPATLPTAACVYLANIKRKVDVLEKKQMQKHIEKQKQKLRQVELTAEGIAARVETKAYSEHRLKRGCCHFCCELYVLLFLPRESDAETEAQKQTAREAAAEIGLLAEAEAKAWS